VISIGKIVNGDGTPAGLKGAVDQAVRYHQDAERDLQVDLFTRKDVYAYYVRGESVGRWAGKGAEHLGLAGPVDPGDFRTVLAGRDPNTGAQLGRRSNRAKVVAYDVAFSAPKSLSIVYATADDPVVREAVMDALHRGAEAATGYLEDRAGWARRWDQRARKPIPVRANVVMAQFLHRLARPVTEKATGEVTVDPQLHIHSIVPAFVSRQEDGVWSMLHSEPLYAHAAAAGAVGQAVMRDHLVRTLGVEVETAEDGSFEIRGIGEEVRREFSHRARQIEEEERALGLPTGAREAGESRLAGHKVAVVATRETKDELVALGDLWGAIRARAEDQGLDQAAIDSLLHRDADPGAARGMDANARDLLGPDGLTAAAASFSRRHVVRTIAAHTPRGGAREEVEEMADRVLTDPSLALRLRPREMDAGGQPVSGALARWKERGLEGRWSTPEMVALEARMLRVAVGRVDAGAGVAREAATEEAIRRRDPDHGGPGLTADQQRMVREVGLSRRGVIVIDGAAGTGKTTAMEALREAFEASGVPVIAHALTGRAARQIREDSGIHSSTIASLVMELEHLGGRLPTGGVVIVDEAGMVGSRAMARLVEWCRRDDVKLVLCGDPKQVQPIDGGAAYRALGDALGRLELTEVVRHRDAPAWQRQALLAMRRGRGAETLRTFIENGGVRSAATGWERKQQMVGDYFAALEQGYDVAMLALRRDDVDDLNDLGRAVAMERGMLSGPEIEVGSHRFQVGDVVMCTQNDVRRFGVVNGLRGTVTAVDPEKGGLTFQTRRGEEVILPLAQYDSLVPGYAMTIAKGQGLNADVCLAMASEGASAEGTYTSLSRHRHKVAYYVVERPRDRDLAAVHHQEEPVTTIEERYRPAFTRWEDKESTLDFELAAAADPLVLASGPATDDQRGYLLRIGSRGELPPEATWLYASVEIDARHTRPLGRTATAYLLEQGADPELTAEAVQQAVAEVTAWRAALRERAAQREHLVGSGEMSRRAAEPELNVEWRVQAARDAARQQHLDEEQSLEARLHDRDQQLRRVLEEALEEASASEPQQPDTDKLARVQAERDRLAGASADTSALDAQLRALADEQREHGRWASRRAEAGERVAAASHELEQIRRELEDLEGPPPADVLEADLGGPEDDEELWIERLAEEERCRAQSTHDA
jgi:conjugative relaxase-like TrwC/TraI family protein